ncbi:uncharacterized protein K452DRAFT_290665 [Aplosporella prunicola CBS 121167]|uniref:MARVEL domain-containing protein n=1 Tax=Aplosporella prunicola CBS 121167 TaxID=1176127 RepID=A0A6A6B2W5_9PEZI|nr:uncharacterized protein K452DRAFT_290665 [Aplosporella prunicola CBS 121167]KAF2138529.1 hypothetical protein K452DRAFT_290665 [Aplosporella prunicola CBS 121167]
MVSKALNLVMRGLQFLWALLIMSLIGNMIATAYSGNPSIVNYSMFVAVFAMLSLFYLIPATLKEGLGVPVVVIALDVLNTIFFLCGGIALAAYLGCHSCSNRHYTATNSVTRGSPDKEGRCREAQASTAFLWFGFAAFAASSVFSFLQSRGSVNMRGGIRRGPPAMSQV